jgi:hypothetical protein
VSLSPDTLWPPNHKLREVHATVSAAGQCDASSTITLLSITSDEPDNGTGDGDTADDIQDADYGTGDFDFSLRAERQGGGDGRIYTVCYLATAGAVADTVCATVTVPHDQSGHALLSKAGAGATLVIYGTAEASVRMIVGGSVTLVNDASQQVTLSSSPAYADQNGDGIEDAVFAVTPAECGTLGARKSAVALYARWLGSGGYFMASLDPSAIDGVEPAPIRLAAAVRPNPAIGMASIRYALPKETLVDLSVFDVAGRQVARLASGLRPAGEYTVSWRPTQAGLYLYRLRTPEATVQGRFVVTQ